MSKKCEKLIVGLDPMTAAAQEIAFGKFQGKL